MNGTTIRIKVPVVELIALVEKAKAKHEAEVVKKQRAYNKQFAEWKRKAQSYIDEATVKQDYKGWPYRPYPPRLSTTDFDRDIALLKRTSETELVITARSNFLRYIVGE